MRADLSSNFLIGFLVFFIYLVFLLTFSFKSENISIYDRKRFNRNRIIQQLIWIAPLFLGFLYLLLTQRAGLDEFLILVFLPMFFGVCGEYFLFQPHLDSLINNANRLFATIRYEGRDARGSFNSMTDKLLLNRDKPKFIRGLLVDVDLDRVCKNNSGEYFWIYASAKGASEPTIKNLTLDAAKNLLRQNRDIFTQEFNEEPYRT